MRPVGHDFSIGDGPHHELNLTSKEPLRPCPTIHHVRASCEQGLLDSCYGKEEDVVENDIKRDTDPKDEIPQIVASDSCNRSTSSVSRFGSRRSSLFVSAPNLVNIEFLG